MKIAVAIASENALPSAFVVFRGIEESIKKAAELGYDGVELALLDKDQVDVNKIKELINKYNMEIPVISSGQVFAGSGLWFTSPDVEKRKRVIEVFKGLVDVAVVFGAMLNIGRVRGFIAEGETLEETEQRFAEVLEEVSDYANKKGVKLILEPVNRYEINFINNCDQGVDLINKLGISGLGLMPDVFHMNIEDASIEGNLKKYIDYIDYVHFADSNRLAPGWGHLDFESIVDALKEVNYDGWISVEILPEPNSDSAAEQAIKHLRTLIPKNKEKAYE
ncbi:TIM barrel protein [Lutispora sp.]|uniref:TIM barrel protein n=1 Tax=Lutispora sp. TaxID=2828727 RepID=UPI0035635406